ncbi:hypothetical protein NMD51_23740 (plasmid) [Escherichia coli]|uniref:hypothetical protein n=1 Tax=Escherichia TaxID=561 RepID=UPI000DA5BC7B|nr:hypothetical protein [Escherichia coli]MCA7161011.1 hypothetical protein [Escherichia coli]MCA8730226.1 hypothetical protein [Escherichia coli]MCC4152927.1 hypothetical protein [Escherichia coli]MCC9594695.1 hypothetical protein [Escherichia coli]MCD9250193.1 hypothetical protein [Escherichia coli]
MAKVDQTKASRLLSATKTMSLGANKNSIRILYGNHVAENIDFRSEPQQHLKKAFVGGVVARITAERFLLLLMSL